MKRMLIGVLGVILAGAIMFAQSSPEFSSPVIRVITGEIDIAQANEFRLVDRSGNIRARLYMDGDTPTILLLDAKGKVTSTFR